MMTVIAQMMVMTHQWWRMKRLRRKVWRWTGQGPPGLRPTPMGGPLCLLGVVVAATIRHSWKPCWIHICSCWLSYSVSECCSFILTCIVRYFTWQRCWVCSSMFCLPIATASKICVNMVIIIDTTCDQVLSVAVSSFTCCPSHSLFVAILRHLGPVSCDYSACFI